MKYLDQIYIKPCSKEKFFSNEIYLSKYFGIQIIDLYRNFEKFLFINERWLKIIWSHLFAYQVRYKKQSFPVCFFSYLSVTSCLIVAVYPFIEWISIKKVETILATLLGKYCSETFIETRKYLELQRATWAGYKHHNKVEFLVFFVLNSTKFFFKCLH